MSVILNIAPYKITGYKYNYEYGGVFYDISLHHTHSKVVWSCIGIYI